MALSDPAAVDHLTYVFFLQLLCVLRFSLRLCVGFRALVKVKIFISLTLCPPIFNALLR
jgi:hypothetical protein